MKTFKRYVLGFWFFFGASLLAHGQCINAENFVTIEVKADTFGNLDSCFDGPGLIYLESAFNQPFEDINLTVTFPANYDLGGDLTGIPGPVTTNALGGGVYEFNLGATSLAAGGANALEIRFPLVPNCEAAGNQKLKVEFEADDAGGACYEDTSSAGNDSEESFSPEFPSLLPSANPSNPMAGPGDVFTWPVCIFNQGFGDAPGVQGTINLGAELELVSIVGTTGPSGGSVDLVTTPGPAGTVNYSYTNTVPGASAAGDPADRKVTIELEVKVLGCDSSKQGMELTAEPLDSCAGSKCLGGSANPSVVLAYDLPDITSEVTLTTDAAQSGCEGMQYSQCEPLVHTIELTNEGLADATNVTYVYRLTSPGSTEHFFSLCGASASGAGVITSEAIPFSAVGSQMNNNGNGALFYRYEFNIDIIEPGETVTICIEESFVCPYSAKNTVLNSDYGGAWWPRSFRGVNGSWTYEDSCSVTLSDNQNTSKSGVNVTFPDLDNSTGTADPTFSPGAPDGYAYARFTLPAWGHGEDCGDGEGIWLDVKLPACFVYDPSQPFEWRNNDENGALVQNMTEGTDFTWDAAANTFRVNITDLYKDSGIASCTRLIAFNLPIIYNCDPCVGGVFELEYTYRVEGCCGCNYIINCFTVPVIVTCPVCDCGVSAGPLQVQREVNGVLQDTERGLPGDVLHFIDEYNIAGGCCLTNVIVEKHFWSDITGNPDSEIPVLQYVGPTTVEVVTAGVSTFYVVEPTCDDTSTIHPDAEDGTGRCFWDLSGIELCDSFKLHYDAQVYCYPDNEPGNNRVLDNFFEYTFGYDTVRPDTGCGPNALLYDIVKYYMVDVNALNPNNGWFGSFTMQPCTESGPWEFRMGVADTEPTDPFPGEDREYITNHVFRIDLPPGVTYSTLTELPYIDFYTRSTGWQIKAFTNVPPTSITTGNQYGGQSLEWNLETLVDDQGNAIDVPDDENSRWRVHFYLYTDCTWDNSNPDVTMNHYHTDTCMGTYTREWNGNWREARANIALNCSPVSQDVANTAINPWNFTLRNTGAGTAWNQWIYVELADDIVLDNITDSLTGSNLTSSVTYTNGNDFIVCLGDLPPNRQRLVQITGRLEDTNGDNGACDTGTDGVSEEAIRLVSGWQCDKPTTWDDNPPEVCETDECTLNISLVPTRLQLSKVFEPQPGNKWGKSDGPVPLCEEGTFSLTVNNTGATSGFETQIDDILAPGLDFVPGSVELFFINNVGIPVPYTGCGTGAVLDPIMTTLDAGTPIEREALHWDICPAVVITTANPTKLFQLRYRAITTCDFIDNQPMRGEAAYQAPCGGYFSADPAFSAFVIIAGEAAKFPEFQIDFGDGAGAGCFNTPMSVSFQNVPDLGAGGNPAQNMNFFQILPPGMHYVSGSTMVSPSANPNVDPAVYCFDNVNNVILHNGKQILLDFAGIQDGQEVVMWDFDDIPPLGFGTVEFMVRTDTSCTDLTLETYSATHYTTAMVCPTAPGGACPEIKRQERLFSILNVDTPDITFNSSVSSDRLCLNGTVTIDYSANNTGGGYAANFGFNAEFDTNTFILVSTSPAGGSEIAPGVVQLSSSNLTGLVDFDGDGTYELAPGGTATGQITLRLVDDRVCTEAFTAMLDAIPFWGCPNLPSAGGCPAFPDPQPDCTAGFRTPYSFSTVCSRVDLQKYTMGVDADTGPGAPDASNPLYIPTGDPVVWTYEFENTGTTILENLVLTDDIEGSVTCEEGPLPPQLLPGDTFICTLRSTVDTCGLYSNTASLQASPVGEDCGTEVFDPSHYVGLCPGIGIEKFTEDLDWDNPTGPFVTPGVTPVDWTFILFNTGNVALAVTSLNDSQLGAIPLPSTPPAISGDIDGDGLLDLFEIWEIPYTAVATTSGQHMNTATVIGDAVDPDGDSYGADPVDDSDDSHYFGAVPGIDIEKFTNGQQADTQPGPAIEVGDPVHWTYVVSNTGNVPLAGVQTSVIDANEGAANYVSGDIDFDFLLDTNEVWNFEIFGVATAGQYSNNVDVIGGPVDENGNPIPDSTPVSDEDPSHYFGADPGISLQKTVYYDHDGGASCPGTELEINIPGAPVTYCFVITNTGNTYLSPITVNDPALGFTTNLNVLLAPGDTVTTFVEAAIAGDFVNTAEASGNPTDENGDDLPNVDDPTDEDDAEVDEINPGIQIVKTDYAGHDGGAGCPGGEIAFGEPGADVTYCFQIINTGNTYLVDIMVSDTDIAPPFSQTIVGPVAPGETIMLFTERTMTTDLVNTASVTGDPSDENGDPYDDVEDVTDDDDAEVDVVEPGIAISKTVYADHDGGAGCPGGELVQGVPMGPVTYCFVVTNTGDTYLSNIMITDTDLSPSFTHTFVGVNLAPGGTVTTHYEIVIDGDLVNTASTSGNPSDENGDDLPDVDDPTDEDIAEVDELTPDIGIEKTVYYGHDGGASCAGDELEINIPGAPVTYCFVVTNSGETYLSPVTVTDPALGFSTNLNIVLAPGATVTQFIETAIAGDLVNTAATSGNPSDENGDDLPGGEDPTDENDAEVDEINPGIEIIKTGYNGHDTGASCPGTDLTFGLVGDDVTYCFEVVNTGNTYLVDIIVTDTDISPSFSQTIPGPVAPGERIFLHVETTMIADLVNTADVTADPADENGDLYDDVEDVTDDDPAEVDVTAPDIALSKTVYADHDGGAGCPGGELVQGVPMGPVTYCFVVTNTGDTYLSDIMITDTDLSPSFTHTFAGVNLAPGGTVTTYYEIVVDGDLVNTASTSGNPTDENGDDLADVDDPTDEDIAEVDELTPDIGIEKTVYYGHDGGASCEGQELEINIPGAPVTYCFVVTNSGETYLSPVTVTDPALGFSTNLNIVLAPGATVTQFIETAIAGDLINTASTSGNPSDENGDDLPGGEDPTDENDAEVDEVRPGIEIIKTGYNGHDAGASCPGTDLTFGIAGDDVTYCFEVVNTGNTYLVDIIVTDTDISPSFSQTIPGPVAPGERIFLHVETTMIADLVNTAGVTGDPADENGDPYDDMDDVIDDDPAEVDVTAPSIALSKTVYNGHDGGASCAGVEAVTNLYAAEVTYCFVVENTGDTYLDTITVSDIDVSPTFTHVFTGLNLAPGGTATTHVERVILGDLENTADVSGNPTDEDGNDLADVDDVTDDDPADVDMVEPAIELIKTVYIGHDTGASCPGSDYELNVPGQSVTYCFEVINTGDTFLNPVIVDDPALGYTSANLGNLAPGASFTVHVETVMSGDLTNVADVTGNPANEDGSDIPDMDDVTDDDPAEVDVETPAIDLVKTVYSGWDGGGSCPGVDLLHGLAGEQITYCFVVSNSGTAFLTDVTVTDNMITPPFSQTIPGQIAPGQTVVLYTQTTLESDLVNTAEVAGTMSDENGNPVEDSNGDPITVGDDDPAEVDLVDPSIELSKTLYEGHDGGASCQGQELLIDTNGTPVTYCFVVENTGDTHLDNVSIGDPALGYTHTFTGVNLAPGGFLTNHIEVALLMDLLNIADVTGNPTDEDGNDLTNVLDVTDDDPAEVEEVRVGIDLQKTVYAGWDNGIQCPTAGDLQHGINGDDITYCFKVTNTGNTYIVNAVVTDNDITPNYSGVVAGPLPPGGVAYLHVQTTLMGDLVNTASVVGAASDGDGNEYPDIPPLTDEDPAEVDEVAPSIMLSKTVYNGHDGGASCAGVEAVTNLPNADVTYCFVVQNTGDTYLDTITVTDTDITPTFTHVFTGLNLAPGGTATTHVERVIDGDLENTADVTGNPTDENGEDLEDVNDVTDDDPAYVDEVTPAIKLIKTVYIGHDGGASCPGSDFELNVPGQSVTYCFEVINTGDTFLNPVIVDDPALGYTSTNLGNLAPGASVTVHVETVMNTDLLNVADVTGNPANPDGSDIPKMENVTDDDPAEVDVETPAIDLMKTVYSGWDGGGSCPGVDLLQGLNGEQITYCFVVSNSGTAFLTDVTVTDNMITPPFSQVIPGQLAPGQTVVLYTQTTLQSDLVNTADVVGTMSDEDGNPVNDPNDDPITVDDDDPAEVDLVGPGIELSKTVYDSHDGGASCQGQELLVDTNGTPITYCFVVENTGDTHLDTITLGDPDLGYTHTFTGVNLAPGGFLTNHIETLLLVDLVNVADVSGNPTDENGDDLPNVDDVTDDDPAEVVETRPGFKLEKTVYAGHDNGLGCPSSVELVNGLNGDDITYCFQLINTGNTYLVNLTVTDTDITPNYMGTVPGPIAPGEVAWLYTEVQLDGDLVNTADATATASDDGGAPYDDIPTLTDDDDAAVDEHAPSIELLKTVYNGHDAGASCPGVESVTNTHMAAVTYCFVVVNTGNTWLDSITVTDNDLSPTFSHTFAGLNLAPGGSATTHVETVIDGDLVNTADVSGNPSDASGNDLPGLDDVTDDDPADVDEIEPAIELLKTVYYGHDGGLSCAGGELHVNVLGTPVTYCFVVVNTGDTWLDTITVTDNDIAPGFTNVFTGLNLAPGGMVTTFTETVLSGALVNTADVSGNPTTAGGDDIPDTDDVIDDDPAEVSPVAPSVTIEKTVYAGHNSGVDCANAGELAYSSTGGPVTYCFYVTNTGDTHLNLVTVTDNSISPAFIGQVPTVLEPNESAWLYAERTATADFTNTASVTGTPSDPDGNTLPDVPMPQDDDTAEVDVVNPSIDLAKTVYLGHDTGASCAGGEVVTNANGAAVTYCFEVTNTGDTWLDTITVTDADVDPIFVHTFTGLNLAPGGMVTTYTETVIDGDLVNTADVTGNPTDQNGNDMPEVDDVTDDDPAEVDEVTPAIKLVKTVYFGHDGGTSCPGTDLHVNVSGTAVTYCFEVINTGDTVLNPVTLNDPDIPNFASLVVPGTTAGPLAPGDSAWFHVETTITSDLVNTASTSGNPANPDGSDIPGMDDVIDDDPAEVQTIAPAVDIQKTVYAGHNGGVSCPTSVDHLDTLAGELVTYCFRVTNTGNTPLVNATVTDNLVIPAYSATLTFVLQPGQSAWLHADRSALGTITNVANVVGTPSDPLGQEYPDVDDVTDTDDADIAVYAPSIDLQKTVYNGHDGGASCAGVEAVTNVNGAAVTYCFVVENTGDTWLDTITISDTDLDPDFSHVFSVNLAPGGMVTTFTETVINGDLVNTADVNGNPTDAAGNDLENLGDVTDDDPATVDEVSPAIELVKTVYLGHDGGVSCPGTDLEINVPGALVTYCFEVINTGDTFLDPVLVTDTDLDPDFFSLNLGALAPGQMATTHHQTVISGDLVNTAFVTGNPTTPSGSDIPDLDGVLDDDPAEVDEQTPSVDIQKTVYLGWNSGGGCPGSELVTGNPGDDITYCFQVTNDGDANLVNVTVTDNDVVPPYSEVIPFMAPGETVTLHIQRTLDQDILNTAGVEGTMADEDGTPITDENGDPITTDDEDTAEVDVKGPAIQISKTVYEGHDGGASCEGVDSLLVHVGVPVTWCFLVENTGDTHLSPVVITDTDLDPALTIPVPGILAPGQTYTAFVERAAITVMNTAGVSGDPVDENGTPLPDVEPVSDDDPAELRAEDFDLALDKTLASTGPFAPGDTVTFTITVRNEGSVAAQNVLIEDRPGPGLTLADPAWTPSGASATRLVAGPIAPGGTESYTIRFIIDAAASGTLENRAEIAAAEDTSGTPRDDIDSTADNEPGDPEAEDDEDGDSLVVERFDLALTKVLVSPGPFAPSDLVTFEITVTNQGTVAAQDILLTDTVPVGLSLADPNWTDLGATAVGMLAGPLAPGSAATVEIRFVIDADASGRMVNVAEISGANGPDGQPRDDIDSSADGDAGNDGPVTDDATGNENGDEDDHDIAALDIDVFDLALVKVLSSPGPFSPGDSITFTISVHNQGDVTATNIELSDYIPAGLTLADPAWTESAGVATTLLAGPLAPSASDSVNITFTIGANVSGSLENFAEISAASDDQGTPRDDVDSAADNDPSNDGPSEDNALDGQNDDEDDHDGAPFDVGNFDLALVKTLVGNGPWEAGDTATFRITVFNQGDVTAQRVLLRDTIPAGLTLSDPAWIDNGDGSASHLLGGLILPGATEFVEISFHIDPGFSGTAVNIAEIESAEDAGGNPRDDIDGTFDADSDNDGPVTDDEINGIGSGGDDEDNHDPASLFVEEFDLAIQNVLTSTGPFSAGDDVTFTITVYNQGNVTAENVQVMNHLPPGLILNDADWQAIGASGATSFINGPIPPGGSAVITLTATIGPGVSGILEDVAEIAQAEDSSGTVREDIDSRADTNLGNDGPVTDNALNNESGDEDDSDPAELSLDVFDLALTKVLAAPGPFASGDLVTYTITVFNQGSLAATQITVTDYLPASLTLADSDWAGGPGNTATVTIPGPLAPGASTTVDITSQIVPGTTGEVVNQAEIRSALDADGQPRSDIDSSPDNDPANDGQATDDNVAGANGDEDDHDPAVLMVEAFDLALRKTLISPGPYFPGDTITYSITIYNQGALAATQIIVTDYLPTGLSLADSDWTPGLGNTAMVTIPGPVPPGGSTSIDITCTLLPDAIGDLENIAEITAANDADGNPQSDIDSVPDSDPVNDGFMVDDEIGNSGNDEDDHDPAMLSVTPLGTIGTTVWIDLSNDGMPGNEQLNELGLEGIEVSLYELVNGVSILIGTAITGPDGSYLFEGLPPGDYVVEVNSDDIPEELSIQTTPLGYTINLGPGEDVDTANFGFTAPPTAVELEFFQAILGDDGVVAEWLVGYESDTLGYNVYRVDPAGLTRINEALVIANGGGGYSVTDPNGIGGTYVLEEVTTHLEFETVAEALTRKPAAPVQGETLILASENGRIELTTGTDHANLLITGFRATPKVTDETNADYPIQLIGEPVDVGDDKGAYLSVQPQRQIKAEESE